MQKPVGDVANEAEYHEATLGKPADLLSTVLKKDLSPNVEAPKDSMDDDMVEGDEDAVIY